MQMPAEYKIAEVLLDQSLQKPLDYSIPDELCDSIQIGSRVEVLVRKKLCRGTISLLKESSDFSQLRPIQRNLSAHTLSQSLWKLAKWMSDYYATSMQKTLKSFTPPNVRKETQVKTQSMLSLAISKNTAAELCRSLRQKQSAQAAILETLLTSSTPLPLSELLETLSISRSPIQTLLKKKIVQLTHEKSLSLDHVDFFPSKKKQLNEEQKKSLLSITESLHQNVFQTHLLFGVTGSGKTEVYLQAIQEALDCGKSALLLVPEIALTSQTIERFQARFGCKIAILHHRRSLQERASAWEGLKTGAIRIAIGARSAIFCPAQQLGLIIVDEEHDTSYKQSEEMPCYHARDVAVMRGKLEQATVVLGSATPSLESYHNASREKYRLNKLTTRAARAVQPSMRIADLKKSQEQTGGFTHFSKELLQALEERLDRGEQALFLLNRRGYRRMQICSECKYSAKCPHCDLSLTYHKMTEALRCHLCDYESKPFQKCPNCQNGAPMQFRGFGTEHVEKSLHALFPNIRTLRMDRDTTRKKESHEEIFRQFRAHRADVLIGTQMIAKGFDFPSVTLVGILNADAALQIPDYRSSESLFQLIAQASGRAGRADLPGEVILQTYLPDHPLLHLAASQDYQAFSSRELEEREQFGFPPFCRLAKIVFSGLDETSTLQAAQSFHQNLLRLRLPATQILPPLPSGHPKIKDRYRFQCLLKTEKISTIAPSLSSLKSSHETRKLQIIVDIDPVNTFF